MGLPFTWPPWKLECKGALAMGPGVTSYMGLARNDQHRPLEKSRKWLPRAGWLLCGLFSDCDCTLSIPLWTLVFPSEPAGGLTFGSWQHGSLSPPCEVPVSCTLGTVPDQDCMCPVRVHGLHSQSRPSPACPCCIRGLRGRAGRDPSGTHPGHPLQPGPPSLTTQAGDTQ